ncbi:DUF1488 family protein [Roseateles chitinivorans]|uniref:DUF1488 family protein n=1 Tax=Roseateles chitinivorans TaxID=2917965 RepID=UPI003D67E66E
MSPLNLNFHGATLAPGDLVKPAAFYDLSSGAVRFWVLVDEHFVGATVRRETLHYRYSAHNTDDDPLLTFQAHTDELEGIVRRRVASGSREPVMLRDHDLMAG